MNIGFDEYMKSSFWQQYYENAPSDKLKDYIRARIEWSGCDPEGDEAEEDRLYDIMREKESKLIREDYDYLIKSEPSKQMRVVYVKRQAKLAE